MNTNYSEDSRYKVTRVDSINNWYLIYAVKGDTTYKIVSRKEGKQECNKISVGDYYRFILHSRRKSAPTIGGVRMVPQNYLDISCYSYDEDTRICLEEGVYDLYGAENIKGMRYLESNATQ
jgi:hypothetical protein